MAYGLPEIVTDLAAEGTGLVHGVTTLAAHTEDEWFNAIISLSDGADLWNRIANNQITLTRKNYLFNLGLDPLSAIFESVGIVITNQPKDSPEKQ